MAALAIFILLLSPLSARSQVDETGFPKQVGSLGTDQGLSITADSQRNIYVAGIFQNSTTFDDTTLTSAGQFDIYVAKYNPNADLLWVVSAGGIGSDIAWGITLDSSNNVYVTGEFAQTAEFDEETTLISDGSADIFVAKYNTNGELQWVTSAGGTGPDIGHAIAIDSDGIGVITGSVRGSVLFDTIRVRGPSDFTSAFVARFNENGRFIWVEHAEGTGNLIGKAIGVDNQDNIYVSGEYSGSATFDDENSLQSEGNSDIYMARYDPNGTLDWVESGGGADNNAIHDIAMETNGDFYITGSIGGDADFDTTSLTSNGGRDIFVAHYNANGVHQWAQSFGGGDIDIGRGISLSDSADLVVTGSFERNWEIDNITLESQGDSDVFLFKFVRDDGELIWARTAGGTGSDGARAVHGDNNGVSLVTGFFSTTADFDGVTRTTVGGLDSFVVRYDEFGFLLP